MIDDLSAYEDFYQSPSEKDRPFSVTSLTLQIKGLLESSLGTVWVRGEISNFKCASSGHAYFSLKDDQSVISAVFFGWKKTQSQLTGSSLEFKDGVEVLCRARVSVYAPRGSYQIIIDRIELLGQGTLLELFEKLKSKLSAQGLFDPVHKKPLPRYPKKIAVITSKSGAALQDILNVLKRRAPQIEIILLPVLVQGESAAKDIMEALQVVSLKPDLCDLVLLSRGGGSQEDLWCFNDESLAHAIFNCPLPIISAVGHEVDFTIADFVADIRAPTPSAGAEILSTHWVEVEQRVFEVKQRLHLLMENRIHIFQNQLQKWISKLVSPKDRVMESIQKCDEYRLRLDSAIQRKREHCESKFIHQVSKMNTLSPLRVLERGYTIVQEGEAESPSKTIIKSAGDIQSGKKYTLQFNDGKKTVQAL